MSKLAGIRIADYSEKCRMDSSLEKLPASALRTIIIRETEKFVLALQYGSTLSDLQEIRDYIITLEDLLSTKEKEETNFQLNT